MAILWQYSGNITILCGKHIFDVTHIQFLSQSAYDLFCKKSNIIALVSASPESLVACVRWVTDCYSEEIMCFVFWFFKSREAIRPEWACFRELHHLVIFWGDRSLYIFTYILYLLN